MIPTKKRKAGLGIGISRPTRAMSMLSLARAR